jgi:DNA polymerase-1
MEAIEKEVHAYGYVTTLLGRRIRFNLWEPMDGGEPLPYEQAIRLYGSKIKRAFGYRGVNYKFQGSEPDIMKTALVKLYQSGVFAAVGYPLLTVHDELDFNKPDNSPATNEAFNFIRQTMENAVSLRVPLKVDMQVGCNWGQLK